MTVSSRSFGTRVRIPFILEKSERAVDGSSFVAIKADVSSRCREVLHSPLSRALHHSEGRFTRGRRSPATVSGVSFVDQRLVKCVKLVEDDAELLVVLGAEISTTAGLPLTEIKTGPPPFTPAGSIIRVSFDKPPNVARNSIP